MKKLISGLLCLVMVLSMGTVAFADSNDFVLTFSNEASYEITIPESGIVDKTTGKGTITIGVSDANLAEGTAVSVTATSANYANGSWYLVNTKDATDKIAYTIGTTDGGSDVTSGAEILSADNATSATFYVTVSDTSKVGTFTDTITFTSEIVEAVSLISFTVEGTPYQAEKGMTWYEWVNSNYSNGNFHPHGTNAAGVPVLNEKGIKFNNDDVLIDGATYVLDASDF